MSIKITKTQLKAIVKEEIQRLNEDPVTLGLIGLKTAGGLYGAYKANQMKKKFDLKNKYKNFNDQIKNAADAMIESTDVGMAALIYHRAKKQKKSLEQPVQELKKAIEGQLPYHFNFKEIRQALKDETGEDVMSNAANAQKFKQNIVDKIFKFIKNKEVNRLSDNDPSFEE